MRFVAFLLCAGTGAFVAYGLMWLVTNEAELEAVTELSLLFGGATLGLVFGGWVGLSLLEPDDGH